jgi:hypothetical protein
MAEYDSPWKEALDSFFEDFLELFFPQAHAEIDWGRPPESLDKELQQIAPKGEIGRRSIDKLAKVWLKTGEEQWVLVHVEVQMSAQAIFPWRMFVYHYRLIDKYNKEVASFAVLGDDDPRWRPQEFSYQRWGVEITFRFPVVKLLDYAAKRQELEASPNPFATVVLAHLDTQETSQDQVERKGRKFRLVKRLRERGLSQTQVHELFRLVDWLMELPPSLDNEFWNELEQESEGNKMPFITTPERYGRARGLAEGRAEGCLRGIDAVLEVRFGTASTQLMPEIRQITDADLLEKILDAAKTIASPDDLRKLWNGQ